MGRANVGNLGRLDGCRRDTEPPLASSTTPPCGGRSPVERAHHTEGAAIHDVGVDHGRSQVFVTEQGLDGADVCARLEEVAGEAVAEGVTGSALVELRRPRRFLYGLLHRRLVQVVEDGPARRRVGARSRGREDVLPGKRRRRVGHLGAQGVWEVDFAPTRGELGPVLPLHFVELSSQTLTGPRRQKRGTVVIPLAAAHHDLPALKVHVLHPYREAFEQAEATAVEDFANEPERELELVEERVDIAAREHRREMVGAPGALQALQIGHLQTEDAPVQEDEGAEGLVLRGGREPALHGEVVQEAGCLRWAHVPWVAASVETDERVDPVEIGFFSARRVVKAADGGLHGLNEGHGDAPGRARVNALGGDEEVSTRAAEELRRWCRFFFEEGYHDGDGSGMNVASGPGRPNTGNSGIWPRPNTGNSGIWPRLHLITMLGRRRPRRGIRAAANRERLRVGCSRHTRLSWSGCQGCRRLRARMERGGT